jgi:VanZ family protein
MQNPNWLRRWGPVILGGIVIWIFSTEYFSDVQTARVIVPTLHWVFPWMSPQMLHWCHMGIRKLAHVSVYFVFGLLLLRAIRWEKKIWRWSWAWLAIGIAAGYAVLDEFHQSFVPLRHPSARDVLLDVFGALSAQLALWTYDRWRRRA